MKITDEKAIEFAQKRAEAWFAIHADQRLKLLNFYMILLVAVIAGSLAAFEKQLYVPLLVLALLMSLLTYCFQQLDQRTRQLIKSAEFALDAIESELSTKLNMSELRLISKAEEKNGVPSYRETFVKIFNGAYLLSAMAAAYSVFQLLQVLCAG